MRKDDNPTENTPPSEETLEGFVLPIARKLERKAGEMDGGNVKGKLLTARYYLLAAIGQAHETDRTEAG